MTFPPPDAATFSYVSNKCPGLMPPPAKLSRKSSISSDAGAFYPYPTAGTCSHNNPTAPTPPIGQPFPRPLNFDHLETVQDMSKQFCTSSCLPDNAPKLSPTPHGSPQQGTMPPPASENTESRTARMNRLPI